VAESSLHQELVQILKEEAQAVIPSDKWGLMQIDSPDSLNCPPRTTEGYRPDVYFKFEKLLVIGEAKTSNDIGSKHSRAQYASYLKECSRFQGQAFFIMVVPLLERVSVNNILNNLKKKIHGGYQIIIKGHLEGS
jgi:hypothetical protein